MVKFWILNLMTKPGISILQFYSDGGGKDIGVGEENWGFWAILGKKLTV